MSLEDRLDEAFRRLSEGWDELGISDPNLQNTLQYTDAEISSAAPKPYGFGYYGREKKHQAMAEHPLYIQQVKLLLSMIMDQIYRKRHKEAPQEINIRELPQSLETLSDAGVEIAQDIGWGDPKDVMIAIQQHPFVAQLTKLRDSMPE